ncbi:Vacuolar inheritance and morphology protein [Coemansia spiralis]|nr:Vacuolar inheritance and morphology protein [Coemansia spiralis]
MGDDDEQQPHRTMIKQLTDLDDHALDEQAGLFMHPRRKSLRTETTPRPLSQPFFQPLQVFPDVLSVSAMVERQEQKDHKGQQRDQGEPTAAHQQLSAATPGDKVSAVPTSSSSTAVPAPGSSGPMPPASALAQYPRGLAVQMPATAGVGDGAAGGDGRGKPALRSVSLTRIAAERAEAAAAAGRPPSGSDALRRDGTTSADPSRTKRQGATPGVESPLMVRPGMPLDTPAEEGDRQLGAETSRASRVSKRTGKRAPGAGAGSDGRGSQALGGRFFGRRANTSSRGSEEDNSDGDEQFIYRHSRSSLQVSSIPEECYDDRGEQHTKRRANRHRLSTYMGGEQRDSVGRVGPSTASTGSYAYSTSAQAPGSGSGGGRPGRRAGRTTRAGGGPGGSNSVATNPASAGGYPHQASINNSAPGHPHRFSILAQPNNDFGLSSEESDIDAEPAGLRSTYSSNMYSRRNSRRQQANIYYGSSEDMPETAPLFRRRNARRKRTGVCAQALRAVGVAALALGSLLVLVALFNMTSAPLADVEATKVTNILATEKELLFILHVQATNPNIREVLIERAEIGVFAAAAVGNGTVGGVAGAAANETRQAILLGNVYELSDPMRFAPGSLRTGAAGIKTTQISIHHPGGSVDGPDSSRWRQLLQGPYDLTVRGTLRYTLWQRNYAARICIAKLANLPPESNATDGAISYFAPAALGCDEGDDDDVITLPTPPAPPLAALARLLRL